MDNSENSEKAIILYDSGHGSKQPEKYKFDTDSDDNWKMLGV